MRQKLLLLACFVVSALPWVAFVACCVHFGTFEVLMTLLRAVLALVFVAVAVLVTRGCALELYERLFEQREEQEEEKSR